jgi:hypothetical protein
MGNEVSDYSGATAAEFHSFPFDEDLFSECRRFCLLADEIITSIVFNTVQLLSELIYLFRLVWAWGLRLKFPRGDYSTTEIEIVITIEIAIEL